MPEILNETMDLCHHEEEENEPESWYFMRFPEQTVSQDFATRGEAMEARTAGRIKWEA